MYNNYSILLRPLLTEKSTKLSESLNKYVFQVAKEANKLIIKKAVEEKFNVKVKTVRTIRQRGKMKNTSIRSGGKVIRTSGYRSEYKKAIVTLKDNYKIDLVGGEV